MDETMDTSEPLQAAPVSALLQGDVQAQHQEAQITPWEEFERTGMAKGTYTVRWAQERANMLQELCCALDRARQTWVPSTAGSGWQHFATQSAI